MGWGVEGVRGVGWVGQGGVQRTGARPATGRSLCAIRCARRTLEHVVAERDDDELRVARSLLDVVADDAHVAEVERGVDLVHDVQRRGLVVVQREHERERGEGLLAARGRNCLLSGCQKLAIAPSGMVLYCFSIKS